MKHLQRGTKKFCDLKMMMAKFEDVCRAKNVWLTSGNWTVDTSLRVFNEVKDVFREQSTQSAVRSRRVVRWEQMSWETVLKHQRQKERRERAENLV